MSGEQSRTAVRECSTLEIVPALMRPRELGFASGLIALVVILRTVSAGIDQSQTTNGTLMRSSSRLGERSIGFGGPLTQMAMFLIFWFKHAVTQRLPSVFSPD
jgi:hypothetical protein